MQSIHLVLSFDHELSLGRVTSSYADNLFRPTQAILHAARASGVPVTLFTDVLCAVRHREWGETGFVEPYEDQLREAIRGGHEVELHLHPHWLDVPGPGARSTSDRFALHDFRDEPYPRDIPGIVELGAGYLRRLGREVDPSYASVAFRAGGFALAPSQDLVLAALWNEGIRVDSSVVPGYRFTSPLWSVDFRSVPRRANWFLAGGIFEVPIVSTPRHAIGSALDVVRRVRRRRHRPPSTGTAIYAGRDRVTDRLRRQLAPSSWMLTFDIAHWTVDELLGMLASWLRRHRGEEAVYGAVISHPKNMGQHSVRLMSEFVDRARTLHGPRLTFCRYADIARRIGAIPASTSPIPGPRPS